MTDVFGEYPAHYVKNYDGDTITIKFMVWFGVWVERSVRLGGVDCPEYGFRAKCDRERELGAKAKGLVYNLMKDADQCIVRVYKYEKYGRLLVDLSADDKDIAIELIKADLARPYYGGKRKGWC